jgi:hypothetical protein
MNPDVRPQPAHVVRIGEKPVRRAQARRHLGVGYRGRLVGRVPFASIRNARSTSLDGTEGPGTNPAD